jgi:4-amino-4-deoxy-L-arabinose transferase-like glycosyltransferase
MPQSKKTRHDITSSYYDFITWKPDFLPWVLILVIIVAFALIRIRLLNIPLERDEGEYAYAAQMLLQGEPFYLSFYNYKLPGIYAAYAIILSVFGQTIWGIRMGALIVNALTTIIVFLIGKKLFKAPVGVMAGGFFALLSLGQEAVGFSANWEPFVLLPALLGIFLLLKGLETKRDRYFWASGLCLGLAFLTRQHGAAFIAFAVLFFLGHQVFFEKTPWKLWVRQFIWFSLAVALPFGLTCLTMWLDGTFARFWFMNFIYAPQCLSEIPLAIGLRNFGEKITKIAGEAFLIWFLAAIGCCSMAWDKRTRREWLFLLLFTLCSFLAIVPGYWFREHYFMLVMPAVALLVALGVSSLAGLSQYVKLDRFSSAMMVIIFLFALGFSILSQRQYLFVLNPLQISRLTYGLNPFIESLEIAKYIEEHSNGNDRVVIVGSEPQINFYSHRRSSTGYVFVDQLVQNHKFAHAMQQEYIKEVESTPPKFIVVVNVPTSWCLTPTSDRWIFRWVDQFVNRYYKLVGVVDIKPNGVANYYWNDQADPEKLKAFLGAAIFMRK